MFELKSNAVKALKNGIESIYNIDTKTNLKTLYNNLLEISLRIPIPYDEEEESEFAKEQDFIADTFHNMFNWFPTTIVDALPVSHSLDFLKIDGDFNIYDDYEAEVLVSEIGNFKYKASQTWCNFIKVIVQCL